MLDMGVKVGLGTDGALTNDSLDMMHAMNFAALIHKVNYGYSRAMTAERVLDISTRIASKALGVDTLVGSLEQGKRADLVFVDMKMLGMAPALLPVKNLIYSANSSCVESVMINGEFVMKNRRLTTIDLEKAILNGEKAAWSLIEKSGHLERNPGFLERGGLYYSN